MRKSVNRIPIRKRTLYLYCNLHCDNATMYASVMIMIFPTLSIVFLTQW